MVARVAVFMWLGASAPYAAGESIRCESAKDTGFGLDFSSYAQVRCGCSRVGVVARARVCVCRRLTRLCPRRSARRTAAVLAPFRLKHTKRRSRPLSI